MFLMVAFLVLTGIVVSGCALKDKFCKPGDEQNSTAQLYLQKAESVLAILEALPTSIEVKAAIAATKLAIATLRRIIEGICVSVDQFESAKTTVDTTSPVAVKMQMSYIKGQLKK
jgi:hypothetical protein